MWPKQEGPCGWGALGNGVVEEAGLATGLWEGKFGDKVRGVFLSAMAHWQITFLKELSGC